MLKRIDNDFKLNVYRKPNKNYLTYWRHKNKIKSRINIDFCLRLLRIYPINIYVMKKKYSDIRKKKKNLIHARQNNKNIKPKAGIKNKLQ